VAVMVVESLKIKNPVTAKPQQDTHTHALAGFIKRPQAVTNRRYIFIILHRRNNRKILITYF
jgi:hypothetical protein